MANVASAAQVSDIPAQRFNLEKLKEEWLGQLILDRAATLSVVKVAIAICPFMNRKERGWAFPGFALICERTGLSRSSVIRAIDWLETHGFLRVDRRRVGKRNLANRYCPLLKRPAQQQRHQGSVVTMKPGSVAAATPEPLTEPLKEPLTPWTSYMAATDVAAPKTGKKEVEEERGPPPSATPKRSLAAQCYELARQHPRARPGDRAMVARALQHYSEEEVLDFIKDAIETGEDLAYVLLSYGV